MDGRQKEFAAPATDDSAPRLADPLSLVLISLMKGVLYRERSAQVWHALLDLQAAVRDYVAIIGLEVIVDEDEGFAFLRQRPPGDGRPDLPRLVPRRPLGYPVSLLLALLRKRLAEADSSSGETRLIVTTEDIVQLVRLYMPDTGNEARVVDRLEAHIRRIVELGFLRPMEGRNDQFEVMRIIKAFVDAQWMHDFNERLTEYLARRAGGDEA